ncbi:MAG TPA: hypothetical protein VMV86_06225 [Methanosarcinales archaeon]|nr:hypothetical protein [Methanosarcinales archaeon]
MELKTVLEVAKFLGIKTRDITRDSVVRCVECAETDGISVCHITKDGYEVHTNACAACSETTLLYQKANFDA